MPDEVTSAPPVSVARLAERLGVDPAVLEGYGERTHTRSEVSARESRAKSKTDEALIERAKAGEARQLLLDVILPVLADPSIPDEQIGGLLRNTIGMSKLREVVSEGWKKLPRDHGRLSALHAGQHVHRQPPPRPGAVEGVRRRHHVLLRRPEIPGPR